MLDTFLHMKRSDFVALFVIAFVISFCGVFGVSYILGEGWPYFELWAEIVLTILFIPLVAGLFFFLDVAYSKWLKRNTSREDDKQTCDITPESTQETGQPCNASHKKPSRFSRITPQWTIKSIAIFSAIMALCWLPWFIANFPGGTYWDTYYQMFQVYPENHPIAIIPWAEIYDQTLTDAWLVDHHPILTTLIYGAFAWASDQLTGNWMAGVALFCVIQGILHIITFTAATAFLRRIGCPCLLCFLAYLFFALMPPVSTWAMCMVKDSMFGLFYIIYFMMLIEAMCTHGRLFERKRYIVLFTLCAVMLCLTKKTGIFIVLPMAVIGVILCYRHKSSTTPTHTHQPASPYGGKRAALAYLLQGAVPAILTLVIFPLLIFPALNIAPGGKQEALGPLFQQTARYVHDYTEEVTVEEASAIAAVIDYEKLKGEYAYDFQDSIKYRYNLDATPEELADYFKVYLQMGVKHPDAYFGSLMSLAGFYVAPTAYLNIRMVTVDTKMGPTQRYMLWNPDELDPLRNGLDEAYKAYASTPVLNLPVLMVLYTFWLPLLALYLIKRHKLACGLLMIPPLVLLAFCIVAPVYDARYVIPIVDTAPLLLAALFIMGKAKMMAKLRGKDSPNARAMVAFESHGEDTPENFAEIPSEDFVENQSFTCSHAAS